MTEEEEKWFEDLRINRKNLIDGVKNNPAGIGLLKIFTNEYVSETAHFIYELIQNADDTGATNVEFILEKDKLIFKHNGTRHFSISDPKKEGDDTLKLGDINSITSFGNSSKPREENDNNDYKTNTIGKFGTGFKSVFQYTSTPKIYDKNFRFEISDYIVPKEIKLDYEGRKEDETVFIFSFKGKKINDKGKYEDINMDSSYQDISSKLQSLSYPNLFLNNIKNIEYEFESKKNLGMYEKIVIESKILDENTTAEFIEYIQPKAQSKINDIITQRFWKFNRKITKSKDLTCSVAFLVNEKNKLKPIKKTAFCFFSTRENTNLNFLINAPFLLTANRESIKSNESHNKNMINILSKLAGDSLIYLRDIGEEKGIRYIDDNILDIVPKERAITYYDEISFSSFYDRIKEKFETEKLLPTKNGYVTKENAYLTTSKFREFLSNEQLSVLVNNNSAEWVFCSIAKNDEIKYITPLVNKYLTDDDFLNSITPSFIESQSIEWLQKFYRWILEGKERKNKIRTKPIFLNQDKKAVAVYRNDEIDLFLPLEGIQGYNTIFGELLKDEDTKELLTSLGVKEPDTEDYLKKIVLKQYEQKLPNIDHDNTFVSLFKFYNEKGISWDSPVNKFKNINFLKYYTLNGKVEYYEKGSELYYPSKNLKDYFETKPSTKFLDIEYYINLLQKSNIEYEKENLNYFFFSFLKVSENIRKIESSLNEYNDIEREYRYEINRLATYGRPRYWYKYSIDGFNEILDYIVKNQDVEKSLFFWKILANLHYIDSYICIRCDYFKRSEKYKCFPSDETLLLQNSKWLVDKNNKFVAPQDITKNELSNIYTENDIDSYKIRNLIDYLKFKEEIKLDKDTEKAKSLGYNSVSEALNRLEKLEQIERQREEQRLQREENRNQISTDEDISNIDHLPTRLSQPKGISDLATETEKNLEADNSEKPLENKPKDVESSVDKEINDELKDEIKAIKAEAEEKIKKAREEKLTKKIENSIRYSFGWFKYLLEKEKDLIIGDKKSKSREISITFYKVEKETDRILILKNPNRYIPQYIEELGNIPLTFTIGEEETEDEIKKVKVEIEVSSVKNYTLRVKLKPNENIKDIEFSKIYKAEIEAKNTDFLIKELQEKFESLKLKDNYELSDDYDLQKNLCKNIEFVFGPPGTGKTTHLAREVLLPKMKTEDVKILVLTPTNKSADVLTNKIIQNDKEEEYRNFLVRFGITDDENIEQNKDIFHEKFFDIEKAKKNITITTMARFPYDYFMIENRETINLRDIEWDYIVIDEASMIPLAYIVYVLYKAKPKQFIIAGDPFQIDPIVQCKEWKDGNIYDLVNLKSFEDTKTVPHEYKVHQLPIQYRSIPSIGNIFSHFAYGGILEHKREESDQLKLNIEDKINIKSLNIIKYPVSKYESIYRAKRLRYSSPYQIYSALFSFEFTQYLANIISERNSNENIKIGVISPYKAQILLVDKLLASSDIPQNISIQAGTIHGFQGDECNIIIALLNNPPLNSSNKKISLNKQNIINVAISRARDYLFVIMPDDDTENIDDLEFVKNLETLIKKNEYIEYSSKEVEKLMFGSETYLEDNAFSTSHQNVNVYNLPEKCYEIRSEDYSIDIQVHKEI